MLYAECFQDQAVIIAIELTWLPYAWWMSAHKTKQKQ